MAAIFQLLLPIQHGLALHVKGFRLLQQLHSALPLPCDRHKKKKGGTAVSDVD